MSDTTENYISTRRSVKRKKCAQLYDNRRDLDTSNRNAKVD